MNYTEAIALAKAGEENGFGYLYENTYKSKYYLALQYMKHEEEAKDVIQEAYIKAFSSLDKLENPDAFPSWLGVIVANTAKNMLAKKNPVLFSDMESEDDSENFEYQIEDDNMETQPELSFTRQETKELVHELIDSLSEEQRMCILMFHIEGASINEIAAALNCSDNTVKSRLNYGRKNLKAKAEELKKKGYKLYGIAPLPLLLLLLRSDEIVMAKDGAFTATGKTMSDHIFKTVSHTKSMGQAATGAVKAGFFHTAAGKTIAIIIGVGVVGGATVFGVTQLMPKATETVAQEEAAPEEEAPEAEATPMEEETPAEETTAEELTPTEEPQEPVVKDVQDDEYPQLIAGNLTKDELTYVLAYGPEEIPEQGFTQTDYDMLFATLCGLPEYAGNPIQHLGMDDQYREQFPLEEVNRFFSSFTDFQFSEDNDSDSTGGIDVDGDVIKFVPATVGHDASATIDSAKYTDTEMVIDYTFEKRSYDDGTQTSKKRATLYPDGEGLYRIAKIEPYTEDMANSDITVSEAATNETAAVEAPAATSEAAVSGDSYKQVYEGVLQSVQNQEAGYEFPSAGAQVTGYSYFLYDMDGDGVKELIVGAKFTEDVFESYDCRAFSCEATSSGYQLKPISGDVVNMADFIPTEGNGLYKRDFSRGSGSTDIYRVTIESGALVVSGSPEYQFTMGDNQATAFYDSHRNPQWFDISDLSGLDA